MLLRSRHCSHICKLCIPAKLTYLSELYGISHQHRFIYHIYYIASLPLLCVLYLLVVFVFLRTCFHMLAYEFGVGTASGIHFSIWNSKFLDFWLQVGTP